MYNRGYNRKRHRRVTGRFYAFLTVVFVLCVMGGVLIANRTQGTAAPPQNPMQPTPGAVIETPAPEASPDPGGSAPAEDEGVADPAETAGSGSSVASVDDLLEMDPDLAPATGDERIDTSSLSVTEGLSPDWRNILLLGTDVRNIKKPVARTDTIMIASVNTKDGRIKLTSILRDMVVQVTNKKGVTKDAKMNTVVAYGGPEAVMKRVNELFGMNITEYVMVNFASFQRVIDVLGGIKIDVTEAEKDEINKSLGEQARSAGYTQEEYLAKKDEWTLKAYGGDMLLNGTQALGYARIRHVGNSDYQRTDRQKYVLDAVLQKVKEDVSVGQLLQMGTAIWGDLDTNINLMTGVNIATAVLKNGSIKMETLGRIPWKGTYKGAVRSLGSALYDTDYEANKALLYNYIYGEQAGTQ